MAGACEKEWDSRHPNGDPEGWARSIIGNRSRLPQELVDKANGIVIANGEDPDVIAQAFRNARQMLGLPD